MKTGLCSITFRKMEIGAIVALVREAGLDGIEWGGDVHVPHGDLVAAREARLLTLEAGLAVSSYGSYFRLGAGTPEEAFDRVLDTAETLGTDLVRVWPGGKGSAEADEAFRQELAAEARRLGDRARQRDMRLAFEYHSGSLTDTPVSAVRLLRDIDHPQVGTYWQTPLNQSVATRCESLAAMLPWLRHMHVFHWTGARNDRLPLAQGEAEWRRYLALARAAHWAGYLLLEYVQDDAPARFLEDARTLKGWSESI